MSKIVAAEVRNKGLEHLENNCNEQTFTSDVPADRAEAVGALMLATVAMTAPDFTIANGSTPNSRKITPAAKNGVSVTNPGVATHRCFVSASELLAVTEVSVSEGNGRENAAAGGSGTTIVFDAGASGTDDLYNGMAVTLIRAADGSSETRIVSDYVGATKTATVPAWSGAAPLAGDTFAVYGVTLGAGSQVDFAADDLIEMPQADAAH